MTFSKDPIGEKMESLLQKLLWELFMVIIIVNVAHAQPACDDNRQSFACSCSDSSDGLSVSCEYRSLNEIPDGIPDDVVSLNLKHNKIEELKTGQLERFSKLKSLVLQHNGLRTIEEKAFSGLDDLEVLDLSYNKMTSVPCEEFQWIPKLKTLHMMENLVMSLSGQCFLPLTQIQEIDLSSTNITSVEEIPFDQMENLKLLDLSGNSLQTIPAGFCPEMGQTVNLHWNPWLCDCALKPLRECESLSTEIKCAMPYHIRGWSIGDLENADQWMACGLPKAVSSKVMHIEEGEAVNLACDPEVDPYGDVVWWLVEDETWQARGEITIYVQNDHAGTYVCAQSKDKSKWAFQEVRVIPPETTPTPYVIPQFSTAARGSTKSKTTPLKTTTSESVASSASSSASPEEKVQSTLQSSSSSGSTSSGNGAGGNVPKPSTPSSAESAKTSTAARAETSPKGVLPLTTKGSGDVPLVATVKAGDDNNAVPLVPGSGSKTTPITSTSSGAGGALGGPLSGPGSQTSSPPPQSGQDGVSEKSRHRGDAVYPGDSTYGKDQTTQSSVLTSDDGLGAGVLPGGAIVRVPLDDKDKKPSDGQVTKTGATKRSDMSGMWVIIAVAAIIATYILIGLLCCICYKCRNTRGKRNKKPPIVLIEESPEKHGFEDGNESIELVEKSPNFALPDNVDDKSPDTSISTDNVELSDDAANPTKWTAPGVPLALPDQNEDTGQILDRHSRDPSDRSSGPPRSDEKLTQETAILDDSTDNSADDDEIPENDKWMNPNHLQAIPDLKTVKPDPDSIPDLRPSRNGSESFWNNPLTSLDRKKMAEEPFQSKDDNSKKPKFPADVTAPTDLSDLPLFRSPKESRDTQSSPDQEHDGSSTPVGFENPWKRLSAIDSIPPYDSLTSSPTSSVKNDPTTPSKEPPLAKIQDIFSDHLQRKKQQKPTDEPKKENVLPPKGNTEKPRSPSKVPANPETNIDTPPTTITDKPRDQSPRRPPQEPSDEARKRPAKPSSNKPNGEPQSPKPKENEADLRPQPAAPSDQPKSRPLSLPLSLPDGLKKLSVFAPEESEPAQVPAKPPRKSHKSGYASLSRSTDFVIPPFDN
ncbi:uncharacterized protein [Branchiostoma lanceolatum]|uniref:uncharacterized protein n=1 Tax=Branchiostoma lanceolatum TaxID=7740 RepID=UPI003451BA52